MWVKLDDGFPDHPKVLEAGDHLGSRGTGRVIAIWIVGLAYCNRNLTDGFVPDRIVRSWKMYDKAPMTVAMAMAIKPRNGSSALLDQVGGGFQYHDYGIYQPLAKDIKAKRDWDMKRKQLYSIPGLIDAIHARDQNLCRYCTKRVNWRDRRSPDGGTYDHVIPRGDNSLENVVTACYGCNVKKGGRTPNQAAMPLLPPPPRRGPDESTKSGTSSDLVTDHDSPDPGPFPSLQKDHGRASRAGCGEPVENLKVLKALIWREVHAAYCDPCEHWGLEDVTERLKVVAARSKLIYAVDFFHEQISIAMLRVEQQHRRRSA